jgi:hypothetical protein
MAGPCCRYLKFGRALAILNKLLTTSLKIPSTMLQPTLKQILLDVPICKYSYTTTPERVHPTPVMSTLQMADMTGLIPIRTVPAGPLKQL